MKVLVLEDNILQRVREFKRRFTERGWAYDCVEHASDCIRALSEKKYNLVFLDHDLNGQTYVNTEFEDTGSGVARWWKNNEHPNKETPLILHTYNNLGAVYMHSCLPHSIWIPRIWESGVFNNHFPKQGEDTSL